MFKENSALMENEDNSDSDNAEELDNAVGSNDACNAGNAVDEKHESKLMSQTYSDKEIYNSDQTPLEQEVDIMAAKKKLEDLALAELLSEDDLIDEEKGETKHLSEYNGEENIT